MKYIAPTFICLAFLTTTLSYAVKLKNETASHINTTHDSGDKSVSYDAKVSNDMDSLRSGVINELDKNKNLIRIADTYFSISKEKTIVFYNGKRISFSQVTKGAKIKFLLGPSETSTQFIHVIYLN